MTLSTAIYVQKAGIATLIQLLTMVESKNVHSTATAQMVPELRVSLSVHREPMLLSRRQSHSTIVSSVQLANSVMEASITLTQQLVLKHVSSVTTAHQVLLSVISSPVHQAITMTIRHQRA